ncbi:hypothetical protein [Natronorubrum halalkaliphilum]|nr:hypothetical protein [Natronorubrum halalkaliphilum]
MSTIEPSESTVAETTDQTDVPIYLPGTPTLSFTSRLERVVDALRR